MINIVKDYGVCFVDCRKIDEGIDSLFALREINALCLKLLILALDVFLYL